LCTKHSRLPVREEAQEQEGETISVAFHKGMRRMNPAKNGDRQSGSTTSRRTCAATTPVRPGDGASYAYNIQGMSAAWNEHIHGRRLLAIQKRMPDDRVRTWEPEEQTIVRRVFKLAHEERREEALEAIRACPFSSYLLKDYFCDLCEVRR